MKKHLLFVIVFCFFSLDFVNAQVVFTEDFENAGAIPAGWTQEYASGTYNWSFASGASGGSVTTPYSGSYNALFQHNSHSGYKTKLVSPQLNLAGLPSPSLNFWHAQENYLGDQDTLRLYYKTSATGQWNLLETWSNSISAWTLQTIELPNPTSTYYFAFEGSQNYGRGIVIDDVFILESSEYAFQVNPKKTLIRQWVEHDTTFLVEVQNTGLQDDTLDFNAINANWTTVYRDKYDTAPISWIALDSGAKDTFLIKVSVPLSAQLHELDTARFSLVSRANPSITHEDYVVTRAYGNTIVPFYEDFDNLTIPNNLLVDAYGSMFYNLKIGNINPSAHSGNALAYTNNENPATNGDSTRLYFMCDLSNSLNTEYRFWMYHTNTNPAQNDSIRLQYSYNGKNWSNIDTVVHRYRADGNYWEEHIVDLSAFDGDTVWFGLLAYSANGERTFYDDIYIGPRPSENLVISEIMYNSPETGQDSLEFIEIYNNGVYPLDIGNYQIGYNSTYQTMSYGLEVDPYKSIVLATDSIAFENFYGFSPTLEWNATNQLDDNEAAIWIKDNNGILLDSVYYRDTFPWPNMAAGNGASLVLCDLLVDNNDGNNWHYSMTFVDTIASGMEVWASPGQPNTASCNYYDIAIIDPSTEVHDTLYYCEMPSPMYDTLSLEITNIGIAEMIIGDTIFMSYQINAAAAVYDTIVLLTAFAPGDTMTVQFQQSYDFSADASYEIQYEAYPISDAYPLNNEAIHTKINFVVDLNLPGVNDTLETMTYPVNIDAGATTSSGWSYSAWDWSTTETTQTIDVSADGWYYVTVTTALDSVGNQCSVIDSVYVHNVSAIDEINNNFSIFPNPNNGSFVVNFEQEVYDAKISIINLQGQMLYEKEMHNEAKVEIDLGDLAKGVYFVRLSNNEGTLLRKMIIE